MNNPDHIYMRGYGKGKIRIQDPGWKKFGSGMDKLRIRDGKHTAST
jgi:hypothetical protein